MAYNMFRDTFTHLVGKTFSSRTINALLRCSSLPSNTLVCLASVENGVLEFRTMDGKYACQVTENMIAGYVFDYLLEKQLGTNGAQVELFEPRGKTLIQVFPDGSVRKSTEPEYHPDDSMEESSVWDLSVKVSPHSSSEDAGASYRFIYTECGIFVNIGKPRVAAQSLETFMEFHKEEDLKMYMNTASLSPLDDIECPYFLQELLHNPNCEIYRKTF